MRKKSNIQGTHTQVRAGRAGARPRPRGTCGQLLLTSRHTHRCVCATRRHQTRGQQEAVRPINPRPAPIFLVHQAVSISEREHDVNVVKACKDDHATQSCIIRHCNLAIASSNKQHQNCILQVLKMFCSAIKGLFLKCPEKDSRQKIC